MTPSQIEQYRPGFESWYRSNPQNIDRPGLPLHRWNLGDDGLGDYRNQFVRAYWEGWIASKADSQVVAEEMGEDASAYLEAAARIAEGSCGVINAVTGRPPTGYDIARMIRELDPAVLSAALNPVITPVDEMEANDDN